MAAVEAWWVQPTTLDANSFAHLEPWLKQLERDTGGEWDTVSVVEDVVSGRVQILAAVADGEVKAVAGLEIKQFRNLDRVGSIAFCVGSGRKLWQHLFNDMVDWFRSQGCIRIKGQMRKGWTRALADKDFKVTHVVAELEIA
ncbi:MAG: hypothetical protein ACE37E_01225 [Hyphomicrobiales bacterium]